MENENFGPFLSDKDVWAMVKQPAGTVFLAALDCNWTGENRVSGEKDYFNMWVAVNFCEEKDKVFLHGARFSNWNLEYELKPLGIKNNTGLFRLALDNPNEFPNEFVIRLERESGEQIYDNNNYRNFSIEHSKGHFASAISQGGNVLSFETIIPIKVINNV
jgi:hypothetical protein